MNGIPAIPSGLSTPDLTTALNDRLRRIQIALTTLQSTSVTSPSVTVVQQITNPSTGQPTADLGQVDSITAVDASSLPTADARHFPHWQDGAGTLHTVISVTLNVTTNEPATQLVTLYLNQGYGPLWLGQFGSGAVTATYAIGQPGLSSAGLWTPVGANQQWTVSAVFGAIANNGAARLPAGAVTSAPFTVYCRSGSYAQVQNPVNGQNALVGAQSLLANGNPGGNALLTLGNSVYGVGGVLQLNNDDGTGLALFPYVKQGGIALPAGPPLGYFEFLVLSPLIGGQQTVKVPFWGINA